MAIITQSLILKQLKFASLPKIKSILGRQRLKFSYEDISFYLYQIHLHQTKGIYFKDIHKKLVKNNKIDIKYNTYMHNIGLISPLMQIIFNNINNHFDIKPSKLLNISDTTLLATKQERSINHNDYQKNKVTVRKNKKTGQNYHTCGYKGLFFMNRFKQIYYVNLLNINYSDHNILKDSAFYLQQLKGYILVDRGMSNKTVRTRVDSIPGVKMISPNHYKQIDKYGFIEEKYLAIYKKRWNIEVGFRNMKSLYGKIKLNLFGVKKYHLIKAKLLISVANYNLSLV